MYRYVCRWKGGEVHPGLGLVRGTKVLAPSSVAWLPVVLHWVLQVAGCRCWCCCLRKKNPRRARAAAGNPRATTRLDHPLKHPQGPSHRGSSTKPWMAAHHAPRRKTPRLGQKSSPTGISPFPFALHNHLHTHPTQPTGTGVVPCGRSLGQARTWIPFSPHSPSPLDVLLLHSDAPPTYLTTSPPTHVRLPVQTRIGPRLKIAGGTSSAAWHLSPVPSWIMEPRSAQAPSSSSSSSSS